MSNSVLTLPRLLWTEGWRWQRDLQRMPSLELESQVAGVQPVSDCLRLNWVLAITAILSILETRGARDWALIINYSEMISSVHSPGSLVLIDHNGFTRGKVAKPTLLNTSLSSSVVKSVLVASRIPPLSLVCRASLDQNPDRSRSRNAREECFRLLNIGLPHNCASKIARGLVPPGMSIAPMQRLFIFCRSQWRICIEPLLFRA